MHLKLAGRVVSATGLIAAIGVYLAWEIAHRTVYAYNTGIYQVDPADEWRYTACSRLVLHGYAMFSQVFSAQPPLLFASLAGGMQIFGDSIGGARWVEILFGLLALLSVAWIAYRLAGAIGAGFAALILAVSPGFLVYAHTIEAEGPMMALAALSLALLVEFRVRSRRLNGAPPPSRPPRAALQALLVLGGLALAAAILMKLFALETVLPALLLLALAPLTRREKIRHSALFLSAAFVPVILDFSLVSPSDQWRQVIELHNKSAGVHLANLIPPLQILGNFLSLDLGLSVLAGVGLFVSAWTAIGSSRLAQPSPQAPLPRAERGVDDFAQDGGFEDAAQPSPPPTRGQRGVEERGVLAANASFWFVAWWLLGSIVMLALFRPLFPHHAAILAAPLAAAAALGVPSIAG
jgi:4-amino-4-deoxy-L-arabinose transferase-like glycosyltransferase